MLKVDAIRLLAHAETRSKGQIVQLLVDIENISGDIAEFGVYRGQLCRGIAELQPYRTVWAFDTFKGMPKEDHTPGLDDSDPPGKWATPNKTQTMELLTAPNIRIMEGRFVDTLPNCNAMFAFVHIDCDTYNGYRQVLTWLVDHLVVGAMVVLDDYPECRGAKKSCGRMESVMAESYDMERGEDVQVEILPSLGVYY